MNTTAFPRDAAGAPTVLVLGARGRIGAAAVDAFARAGWQVVAQARRIDGPEARANVRWTDAPLGSSRLADAAGAASHLLHAVNVPYPRWQAEVLPLARVGMDLAERLGARFMLPGNVYNFGAGMPALLEPDTPERPTARKGALRAALERELAERAAAGRLRATVLRAGDFFGGAGSWLDLVIAKSLPAGRLVYPGPTALAHAWAYLPDVARAFVALAERASAPAFERLHFAGHTLTGDELLAALQRAAAALGVAPARGWRVGTLPWAALRVGGLVVPMWRELHEMRYLWQRPHQLDGEALERAVGPLPATPLATALRQSLLDMGVGRPAAAERVAKDAPGDRPQPLR